MSLPDKQHHPDLDLLLSYAHGRVSEGDAREVEQHLQQCDDCCETLSELPADRLTTFLQQIHISHQARPAQSWRLVPGYEILEEIGRGGMGMAPRKSNATIDIDVVE